MLIGLSLGLAWIMLFSLNFPSESRCHQMTFLQPLAFLEVSYVYFFRYKNVLFITCKEMWMYPGLLPIHFSHWSLRSLLSGGPDGLHGVAVEKGIPGRSWELASFIRGLRVRGNSLGNIWTQATYSVLGIGSIKLVHPFEPRWSQWEEWK